MGFFSLSLLLMIILRKQQFRKC
ncbi:hypothetical protein D0T66_07700 [Dysgonomonas sp. 25]|nr:hypothetical protein [Dysgonomonas sp. 25]